MAALKIIIAGGGTGGHIFPALAIGHALKKNNQEHELLYVGAKHKMEMEKVPQAGFKIIGLDIVGFNRAHLLKNISLPFKLIKAFWEARKIIKTFQPDVVVGVVLGAVTGEVPAFFGVAGPVGVAVAVSTGATGRSLASIVVRPTAKLVTD